MKRKRSQLIDVSVSQKKPATEAANDSVNNACYLTHILAQYGLLESITSRLFPNDLYSLASTSRAAYKAIFPRSESRLGLLKKMQCAGDGIRIRERCHQKSKYFYHFGCEEYAICGTNDRKRNVESRSCVQCGVTTCDECRIHCVYQSIFQPPDDPDELPNFSGFVLLGKPEMGISSPAHLGINSLQVWRLPSDSQSNAYHDQGFLDIPLESDIYAVQESIKEIINTDLGMGQLEVTYSSDLPHPSPVIQNFWMVTEQRKRICCDYCIKNMQTTGMARRECHCTLKSRFLDRWLCLKCYGRERHSDVNSTIGVPLPTTIAPGISPRNCSCGRQFEMAKAQVVCHWCKGTVETPFHVAPAML